MTTIKIKKMFCKNLVAFTYNPAIEYKAHTRYLIYTFIENDNIEND